MSGAKKGRAPLGALERFAEHFQRVCDADGLVATRMHPLFVFGQTCFEVSNHAHHAGFVCVPCLTVGILFDVFRAFGCREYLIDHLFLVDVNCLVLCLSFHSCFFSGQHRLREDSQGGAQGAESERRTEQYLDAAPSPVKWLTSKATINVVLERTASVWPTKTRLG